MISCEGIIFLLCPCSKTLASQISTVFALIPSPLLAFQSHSWYHHHHHHHRYHHHRHHHHLPFLAIIVKVSKQYINTSCKNISDNSKSSNSLQWEGASNTTDGGNFDRSFFAAKCEMMLVALQIWNLMLFLLFLYLLTKACLKLELRWWVCQLLNKKCQRSWYFKIF